jgi:hypothetical protein
MVFAILLLAILDLVCNIAHEIENSAHKATHLQDYYSAIAILHKKMTVMTCPAEV